MDQVSLTLSLPVLSHTLRPEDLRKLTDTLFFSVENTLVIIAASMPMIRPIFAKKAIRKPTSTYEMDGYGKSHSRGAKGYALSSGPRDRVIKQHSSSEENILPLQGEGAIVKKTDFIVTYDDVGKGEV